MKKILSIILVFSLVCASFAQKDTTVNKRKIRPIVDMYIGTDYPFLGWYFELPKDIDFHCVFPYNVGFSAGVAFPTDKGNLLVKTGLMLDGWYLEYNFCQNNKDFERALTANIDVLSVGYEGFIRQNFSLYGDAKMGFIRVLDHAFWTIDDSKQPPCNYPDEWKSRRAVQFMSSLGFYYWFHSQWALNASLFVKMDHYDEHLGKIRQFTIGTTLGVSFR